MLSIGLLTIGQSPRKDIMEELADVLVGAEIIEVGALDGYTLRKIEETLYPEPGYFTYVTRMRDGREVRVAKEKIIPLLQRKIREIEDKVDMIILLCSGRFPRFKSIKPVIYPSNLLKGVALSIMTPGGKLGVVVPLEEQVHHIRSLWHMYTSDVRVAPVSPYTATEEGLRRIAETLMDRELVIMDCIGYSYKQKRIMHRVIRKPVITVRGILRAVLTEIIQ